MRRHILAQYSSCDAQSFVPHSCGHRNCPHCQHFESQRWIERQGCRQRFVALPANLPKDWVVDCTSVGNGQKALVYLGRYLYRGMIAEKDILCCTNRQVTYRWRDSKTKKMVARTVRGERFLQLLLQHVLPKGFRRARNFGFLHTNSKRLIALLRLLVFKRPNTARQIRHSNWHYTVKTPMPIGCCGRARPKTPVLQSRASQDAPQRH